MSGDIVQGTFLWSAPRSLSTAFFRSVESHPATGKAFLEPFSDAYYFGEERVSPRYSGQAAQKDRKFLQVKAALESAVAESSQEKRVFVKDMAYNLYNPLYRPEDLIPAGYRHVFLLRHPAETVASLHRVVSAGRVQEWNYFDESEVGLKELWQLFELIRDSSDDSQAPPLVIEAKDLLEEPELYLRLYCRHTDLPFDEALLNWRPASTSAVVAQGNWTDAWFSSVLAQNGFRRHLAAGNSSTASSSKSAQLPENLQRCVEANLEYYDKFQAVKARV